MSQVKIIHAMLEALRHEIRAAAYAAVAADKRQEGMLELALEEIAKSDLHAGIANRVLRQDTEEDEDVSTD